MIDFSCIFIIESSYFYFCVFPFRGDGLRDVAPGDCDFYSRGDLIEDDSPPSPSIGLRVVPTYSFKLACKPAVYFLKPPSLPNPAACSYACSFLFIFYSFNTSIYLFLTFSSSFSSSYPCTSVTAITHFLAYPRTNYADKTRHSSWAILRETCAL